MLLFDREEIQARARTYIRDRACTDARENMARKHSDTHPFSRARAQLRGSTETGERKDNVPGIEASPSSQRRRNVARHGRYPVM